MKPVGGYPPVQKINSEREISIGLLEERVLYHTVLAMFRIILNLETKDT